MKELDANTLRDIAVFLEGELAGESSPRVFAPLAETYRLQGRLEDAARTARSGLEAHPQHAGAAVVLARTLVDSGRANEAREVYERVLRIDPGNTEARAFLAPSAEPERQQSPPPGQPEAEPLESLGNLSTELGHLTDLFSARVGTDPSRLDDDLDGIATLTLAEIYAKQGLFEKAVEVCERILERDPADEEARQRLEAYRSDLANLPSE